MYNLYNEFPKNNSKNLAQLFTFHNKIKKPLRKIKDVKNCDYVTNNSFFIEFVSDGKIKQVIYEVKSINVRNEIVGKLKYLIISLLYNIHIENESKQKIVFKNEINKLKFICAMAGRWNGTNGSGWSFNSENYSKYISEDEREEKLLANQQVLKTPIVRNGNQASIGYAPEIWKSWT